MCYSVVTTPNTNLVIPSPLNGTLYPNGYQVRMEYITYSPLWISILWPDGSVATEGTTTGGNTANPNLESKVSVQNAGFLIFLIYVPLFQSNDFSYVARPLLLRPVSLQENMKKRCVGNLALFIEHKLIIFTLG